VLTGCHKTATSKERCRDDDNKNYVLVVEDLVRSRADGKEFSLKRTTVEFFQEVKIFQKIKISAKAILYLILRLYTN
jgi:hypothetical protein